MAQYNRIKTASAIDSSGRIVVGAAITGYARPPVELWQYAGQTVDSVAGSHPYLLEDAAGEWEIGVIAVDTDGGAGTRNTLDSSSGYFANDTPDLTLSMGATTHHVLAYNNPSATTAPRASGTSLAAGGNASVAHGSAGGVAVGSAATVYAANSVAVGNNARAFVADETVVSSSEIARTRTLALQINFPGTASATALKSSLDVAMNLMDHDAAITPRNPGIMRVTGTVEVRDDSVAPASTTVRIIDVDYTVLINPDTPSLSVLGTATFTTIHAGASAPACTLTVDSSTGALKAATSYAGGTAIRALLTVHDFQTSAS